MWRTRDVQNLGTVAHESLKVDKYATKQMQGEPVKFGSHRWYQRRNLHHPNSEATRNSDAKRWANWNEGERLATFRALFGTTCCTVRQYHSWSGKLHVEVDEHVHHAPKI